MISSVEWLCAADSYSHARPVCSSVARHSRAAGVGEVAGISHRPSTWAQVPPTKTMCTPSTSGATGPNAVCGVGSNGP